MAQSKLTILLGPCDDEGRVYVNNMLVLKTKLNQTDVYEQELDDGEYRIRFEPWNTGAWGWKYQVELRAGNKRLGPFTGEGATGAWAGLIKEEVLEWRLVVENGAVKTIGAV